MNVPGEELYQSYILNKRLGYLTVDEIRYAVSETKRLHLGEEIQFIEVNFQEPTKSELAESLHKNAPVFRRAEVVSMSLASNSTFVDVVTLNAESEISSTTLHNVQAGLSPAEYMLVEQLTKAFEPLNNVLRDMGLDPDGLMVDAWCCADCHPTERICWPSLFYQHKGIDDLPYARPIEGIEIRISLTRRQIISFENNLTGKFPIPGSFESKSTYPKQARDDLKPIVISQPLGTSWSVSDDNSVNWQKWSFQVGFNSKEGVSLHALCFHGRPVLHKISFCEMVVPYGDPRSPHSLKNAFDAGEDGLFLNNNNFKVMLMKLNTL